MRAAQLVLLLLAAEGKKAAATHAAFKDTAIKQLCDISKQLAKAPAIGLAKYKVLTAAATAARNAAMLADEAAVAVTRADDSAVFKSVALAASNCEQEAVDNLQNLGPIAAAAALTGGKVAGGISEMAEFLRQISYKTVAATTGYCLGTSSAATTAKTLTDLGCPSFSDVTLDESASYDPAIIAETGFAQLTAGSIKHASGANTKCPLLKGGSDTNTELWRENTPTGIKILAGFVDLTPHNAASNEDATMASLNSGTENGKFSNTAGNAAKTAFNAAQELNEFSTANCGTTSDDVIKHVLTANKAKALLESVLQTQEPYKTGKSANKAADEIIKTAAGNADTKTEEKILEKIKAQTVTRIEGDKTTTKPLTEAASNDDERRTILLNHLQSRQDLSRLVSELATAKAAAQKTAHAPTNDDCKDKKGADCKDGCKVEGTGDNKKCVKDPDYKPPQAEGAKESVTATNTTGNNSFVINKAPFFLALLLF
uniref:Variant surface glycoprotein 593 n=1 Tax=Trypanosoma brucei TaxID=5691 RepID=M4T0E5_9TRYP|nr:variant surface glycoprotein 593 [Trypanosoma brucei]